MSYSSTVLADSPIRYYRLGEASGTVATDLGSQAQNGTLSGGITLAQAGLLTGDSDTAMLFTGTPSSTKISLPTTGLPTGASPFSIELWVKLTAGQADNFALLFFGTAASLQQVAIYYAASTGIVNLYTGTNHFSASSVLVAGTINHLVITYDGTTLIAWVNGANVVQATVTLNMTYGSAFIDNDTFTEPIQGVIDEVAIYSVALTTQVSAHYTAGTTAPTSTVVMNSIRYRPRVLGSTLVTKYIPRAFGGTIILGAPTFIATEALTISESAIFTSASVLIDANTANDTSLSTRVALPIESSTIADSLLSAGAYLPVDANTASDIGGGALSRWPIDANTLSDASLSTGIALPLDALSASESSLSSASFIPVDANTVSESLLATRTAMSTEANTLSESMISADVYIPTDALIIIESLLDTDSASFTDANTLSESLSSIDTFMQTDALTVLDTVLDTDIFLPVEVDGLSDSSTMASSPVGGVTTNTMTFEDDLVVSDAFLAQMATIPVDALSIIDSLLGTVAYLPLDTVPISDVTGGVLARWGIDALSVSESFFQETTLVPVEFLDALDVLLATDSASLLDALSIADSFSAVEVPPPFRPKVALVATGRDGVGTAIGRNGSATAVGRDGTGMARGRDGKNTAISRSGMGTARGR